MHAKSLSRVTLFATLWTVARQALLSMRFFKQECRSGLPFPSPDIKLGKGKILLHPEHGFLLFIFFPQVSFSLCRFSALSLEMVGRTPGGVVSAGSEGIRRELELGGESSISESLLAMSAFPIFSHAEDEESVRC